MKKSIFIIFLLIGSLLLNAPTAHAITLTDSKIDFGTNTSPIQSGWTRLGATNLYDEALGYGWCTAMANVDRGAGSGGPMDDLEQDIHWSGLPRTFSFHVDADTYTWTLYYGDPYATGDWDLHVNGVYHSTHSHAGSEWKTVSDTTNCVGGWLNFTMTNFSGGVKWNGIEFEAYVPPTKDLTIIFDGGIDKYYVNGTLKGNETVVVFDPGNVANITCVPKTGYAFVRYVYDASITTDNPFYLTMDTDYTAFAHSIPIRYLTVYFGFGIENLYVNDTIKTNGTITEFTDGQVANITSVLETDYTFFKYEYDSTPTLDNPVFLTMDTNYECTAYVIEAQSGMLGIITLLIIVAPVGLVAIMMLNRRKK